MQHSELMGDDRVVELRVQNQVLRRQLIQAKETIRRLEARDRWHKLHTWIQPDGSYDMSRSHQREVIQARLHAYAVLMGEVEDGGEVADGDSEGSGGSNGSAAGQSV